MIKDPANYVDNMTEYKIRWRETVLSATSNNFQVPHGVQHICMTLSQSGEHAYVVGGSLRDLLAGRIPSDWDIATSATPLAVMGLFRRVVPTGIDHGTVTVLVEDESFEVTTLRGESEYSNGRHPDEVTYITDIEEDLARRDFTINAMAWNPLDGVLHDPFGGQDDLQNGLIKAVGDPVKRFEEDGLRVLRAARFAATLGFEIESTTLKSMPSAAKSLAKVSAERKRDELVKTLGAATPSLGLNLMAQTSLLCYVCEYLAQLANINESGELSTQWNRTVSRVDATPDMLQLRLTSLLLENRENATKWLTGMRFDRKTITKTVHLLSHVGETDFSAKHSDSDIRRLLHRLGRNAIDDFFTLEKANLIAREEPLENLLVFLNRTNAILASGAPISVKELALRGSDIIENLKVSPGPRVGKILGALLDHVLDTPEDNTLERLLKVAENLPNTLVQR